MPGILTAELTTADVVNAATPQGRTNATLSISGSAGRLSVQNREGAARSVHVFTVADAADMGVGGTHGLTAEQAGRVLALSCSLVSPRVLFSTMQPDRLGPPTVMPPRQEPVARAVETSGDVVVKAPVLQMVARLYNPVLVLGFEVSLDEAEVLRVARQLLRLRLFDRKNRTQRDHNVLDAIDAYERAADAADLPTRLQAPYPVLEKAVNAELRENEKEPDGRAFDDRAQELTGILAARVGQARVLNDRLKHRRRSSRDTAELETLLAALPELLLVTKAAADKAIKERLRL